MSRKYDKKPPLPEEEKRLVTAMLRPALEQLWPIVSKNAPNDDDVWKLVEAYHIMGSNRKNAELQMSYMLAKTLQNRLNPSKKSRTTPYWTREKEYNGSTFERVYSWQHAPLSSMATTNPIIRIDFDPISCKYCLIDRLNPYGRSPFWDCGKSEKIRFESFHNGKIPQEFQRKSELKKLRVAFYLRIPVFSYWDFMNSPAYRQKWQQEGWIKSLEQYPRMSLVSWKADEHIMRPLDWLLMGGFEKDIIKKLSKPHIQRCSDTAREYAADRHEFLLTMSLKQRQFLPFSTIRNLLEFYSNEWESYNVQIRGKEKRLTFVETLFFCGYGYEVLTEALKNTERESFNYYESASYDFGQCQALQILLPRLKCLRIEFNDSANAFSQVIACLSDFQNLKQQMESISIVLPLRKPSEKDALVMQKFLKNCSVNTLDLKAKEMPGSDDAKWFRIMFEAINSLAPTWHHKCGNGDYQTISQLTLKGFVVSSKTIIEKIFSAIGANVQALILGDCAARAGTVERKREYSIRQLCLQDLVFEESNLCKLFYAGLSKIKVGEISLKVGAFHHAAVVGACLEELKPAQRCLTSLSLWDNEHYNFNEPYDITKLLCHAMRENPLNFLVVQGTQRRGCFRIDLKRFLKAFTGNKNSLEVLRFFKVDLAGTEGFAESMAAVVHEEKKTELKDVLICNHSSFFTAKPGSSFFFCDEMSFSQADPVDALKLSYFVHLNASGLDNLTIKQPSLKQLIHHLVYVPRKWRTTDNVMNGRFPLTRVVSSKKQKRENAATGGKGGAAEEVDNVADDLDKFNVWHGLLRASPGLWCNAGL